MKNKIFCSLLSILLLFSLLEFNNIKLSKISYANITNTAEASFLFNAETNTITKFIGQDTDIIIPQTINGVVVKKISKSAFSKNNNIQSVVFNEGLEEIGEGAFASCKNLRVVSFPATLKQIQNMAFVGTSIENLNLNEGLEYIGDRAFFNSKKVLQVNIPNSLKSIGNYAFGNTNISGDFNLGNNLGHVGHKLFDKVPNNLNVNIVQSNGEKLYLHDELFLQSQTYLKIPQNREVMVFARAFLSSENIVLDNGEISINSTDSNEDILNKINSVVKLTSGFAIIDKSADMSKDIYIEEGIDWDLNNIDLTSNKQTIFGKFKTISDAKYENSGQNKSIVESAKDKLRPQITVNINQVIEDWNTEDFIFSKVNSKKISTNEYFGITGFSEKGLKKLERNKNLIIPEKVFIEENGAVVEKNITGISENAFKNKGILSVTINVPKNFKEYIIDTGAFSDNNISEINIPNGVKIIEAAAFKNNDLKSLELPESIQKLGNESFMNNKIENLVISDQVNKLQLDAFSFANNKLKEVKLPYSIFKILANVFFKNNGNENNKVVLYTRNPKHFHTLTYIQPNSEYHKIVLTSEKINREELQNKIEIINKLIKEEYNQEDWADLYRTFESAKIIHYNDNSDQQEINHIVEELNDKINKLFSNSINKKELLENIVRLEKLSDILYTEESLNKLFLEIQNIKEMLKNNSITQEEVNNKLRIILKLESELVIREEAKYNIDDFVIEEDRIVGFSDLGKLKFEYNKDLVLPDKSKDNILIKEISDNAFEYKEKDYILTSDTGYSPNGLESVVIPNTIEKIGKSAFRYNKISDIILPENLKYIGDLAFNGNILKTIKIPDNVIEIGNGSFSLNKIVKAKLSASMKEVPNGIFSRNLELTEIELPEGIEIIGQSAFVGVPLTSLNIPSTVKRIERKAFSSHRIEKLEIPSNVEYIGEGAFESNKKFRYLKNVILNEGLKEIGANAFKSCLIEEIYIPYSLEKLDSKAFNDNYNENKEIIKTKVYTNNPNHIEMFSSGISYELIYIPIEIDKLEEKIKLANIFSEANVYNNSSYNLKKQFNDILFLAKEILKNPKSQKEVDKVIYDLESLIEKIESLKLQNNELKINNNFENKNYNEDTGNVNKSERKNILTTTGIYDENAVILTILYIFILVLFIEKYKI